MRKSNETMKIVLGRDMTIDTTKRRREMREEAIRLVIDNRVIIDAGK